MLVISSNLKSHGLLSFFFAPDDVNPEKLD